MSQELEKTEKSGTLGTLRPRDTRAALSHSATYSRVVAYLRWIVPLVVLMSLGALFVWPMWQAQKISVAMVDSVPNLMVEKLNLTGLDQNNQPYSLTADRALQAIGAKNLVDLENPKGELSLQNGSWLAGHAAQGRLDQVEKKLWLGGDVEFFHDQGTRFASNEVNVDLGKSLAWGSQPVVIQGSFGVIAGSGFRMLDGGKTLIITGPAEAKLHLQGSKGSGKPDINVSHPR